MRHRRRGSRVRPRLRTGIAALATVLLATSADAQGRVSGNPATRPLTWFAEFGAGGATPFVEDGNGVEVSAAVGPFAALGVSRPIRSRIALTASLRGASAALRVESADHRWRAGRADQADLRAGLELAAPAGVFVAASGFVARIAGPDDVIPFRDGRGHVWMLGSDVAAHRVIAPRQRVALLVGVSVGRIAGQRSESPPLAAGWIAQWRLGARVGSR